VEAFPFVVRERVRLRDIDSFGHVNNAVYSTYLEQARLHALGALGSVILARVEIDFRGEIRLGEEV
jgi:acyl-CoA thioester hydrolase